MFLFFSFFSFTFTVFILLWCQKQPQLQYKNYCSYFHTQVHALRGNFLYAYTSHVQIHIHTYKYIHATTHRSYTFLWMYPDVKWLSKKWTKFFLTKKNIHNLEDPFNYKLLITHKNYFSSASLLQIFQFPMKILLIYFFILINVIIAADTLSIINRLSNMN